MTDDRFEDFLRDAAQSYNAPPPTPREQMWERIQAARRAELEVAPPAYGAPPARFRRAWAAWAGAVAAALLIGVGIGRWSQSGQGSAPAGEVAVGLPESGRQPGSTPITTSPAAAPQPAADDTLVRQRLPAAPGAAREPRLAAADPRHQERTESDFRDDAAVGAAYRVAAIRHLGQAEALLTSFGAESRSGRLDDQVSAWADDLLSTTRLLMDSPAATDPRMKRLLDDLELVLAQIAQMPVQRDERELELIGRSVEQRSMLTRLRTVVPAGMRPSGT